MSDALAPWMPSLDRARAARVEVRTRVWWRRTPVNLLHWTPREVRPLAALIVRAGPRGGEGDAARCIRYAYVPEVPFGIENGLADLLDPTGFAPPEALRFNPEPVSAAGPYRAAPVSAPDFHGHAFGKALDQARAVLARWRRSERDRGEVEVQTWAWPFLWISFGRLLARREVGLVVRPDHDLHAFVV